VNNAPAGAGRRTVLFLSDETDFTGATVVLLRVMKGLDRSRFTPVAVIHEANSRLAGILEAEGIRCFRTAAFGTLDGMRGLETGIGLRKTAARLAVIAGLTPTLVRCIRASRPDVIHANNYPLALYCAPAALLTRTPFVFHDHNLRDIRPRNWLNYKLAGLASRKTVVVSDACRRNLEAAVPARKIVVIRNGVDLPGAQEVSAQDIRASLGVAPDAPLLANIGQPREEKGIHVFIEAAAKIAEAFPAARFLVVGYLFDGDPYHRRLREMVASLGLERHVLFTGWRDDIPAIVSSLDILVHCRTTPEPAALVLIEGMAAGKPVVVSDTGGSREIVLDGVTGKLYPAGDAAALASCVIELLHDPQRLKEMGAAGRRRVEDTFTVARQVREFEDLYEDIVRSTP
jgi:glycosyltransferase involved in cell wall biosynthesis